ncbi:unnamed protein product [Victoria cruziana]
MEELEIHRVKCEEWKPSPVVALATSPDDAQVAAARDDGTLEIWLVSPGSVGWHCQLTIHGNPDSRISSLAWCRSGSKGLASSGRLFSSSIDGSISEWDLFALQQKVVLDSIGVSIWQIALEPFERVFHSGSHIDLPTNSAVANGLICHKDNDGDDSSDDDTSSVNDVETSESYDSQACNFNQRLAFGCDDGRVRICTVSGSDEALDAIVSMPRVDGRTLSVAWSHDSKFIFSGSSDGFIRCWNSTTAYEVYRITVGLGDVGVKPELCIWSLLSLRNGTLVSADSTGSVHFWDGQHGTLIQSHSRHKGDVNALAATPTNRRVFSAGSDGQVIQYKLNQETSGFNKNDSSIDVIEKWIYIGYIRAHTHDVRALTISVPISAEDPLPEKEEKGRKDRKINGPERLMNSSYRKWARLGVPMLISGGDDTKLFAYSANEFSKFSPHDICPAPQRVLVQLVHSSAIGGRDVILVQNPGWLDVMPVFVGFKAKSSKRKHMDSGKIATAQLLARVKCKKLEKIICSTISRTGVLFAFSDHVKPRLFELRNLTSSGVGNVGWEVDKMQLPGKLPFAHCMVFSNDSSRLIIAGHDRKIYVVDVAALEVLHVFMPCRKHPDENSAGSEPPISRMFTSDDDQWLTAVNCYGDIYIFNLEINRQHWFISRLNGASVTSGGFPPGNSNILVIITSTNHVYIFDVEAKQLGEWSRRHTFMLPRSFQEFPGEVIGLSFPPSINSTSVIVYSARAMCVIDFRMPVEQGKDTASNALTSTSKKADELHGNGSVKKRKHNDADIDHRQLLKVNRNFEFHTFKNPVFFVGHLSDGSLITVEKPWMEVVQTLGAPVHRHIYGS